jgi:hypothetical protein
VSVDQIFLSQKAFKRGIVHHEAFRSNRPVCEMLSLDIPGESNTF